MLHLADHIKSTYREGLVSSMKNESGAWNANLVCKSQAHIPYEQRHRSIGNLPGEMERIDKKPDRLERKGSNIGTFREGHGYRTLARLQHDMGYFTPVWWKKLAGRAQRTRGAEGRECLQMHYITRCRVYVDKINIPVSGRRP